MVHYNQIINGLTAYIDREIVSQLNGSYKGWIAGVASGILATRAGEAMRTLSQNPLIQSMGLADGEMIDEDLLYQELRKQAQRSPMTINVPLLGAITFSLDDVDQLHRYIMGG